VETVSTDSQSIGRRGQEKVKKVSEERIGKKRE